MPESKPVHLRRRGQLRRLCAAAALAALAAGGLAAPPASAAAVSGAASPGASHSSGSPAPAPSSAKAPGSAANPVLDSEYGPTKAEKSAMAAASAQAKKTGRPVAVNALTTETWQVVAQPAGGFALSANTQPVRTLHHGSWIPVDTTLHRNADGTLSPAATAYGGVSFSGGGSAPLATTTSGATSYSLSWPSPLPAPAVKGATATYADVLPGVDLVLSATVSGGFSEVLVVKNAAAARNPKLSALTLGARVSGGRAVKAQAADGIAVAGAANGDVLESSSAAMWDSNTAVPAFSSAAGHASNATAAKAGPDHSDAAHPGAAARTAAIGVRTGADTLTLIPDASLLHSPGTIFPLFLDPTLNWHTTGGGTPAFDEVKQYSPCNGQSYYNNSGSAGDYGQLGVGTQWYSCGGIQRAYYQWQLPHVIWGSDINLASVNATEVWQASFSCSTSRTVNLHWAGGIGSGTSYNNQPGFITGADAYSTSANVGAAYNASGCTNPSSSPAGFTVTTPIAKSAARSSTQFTVALTQDKAEAGGDSSGFYFDRFADNPTLNIQYNLRPNTPGATSLWAANSSDNAGCTTSAPYPLIGKSIASNPPTLNARISDPDGDTLQAQFQYWVDGSSSVTTALSGDNIASGNPATAPVPASFISTLSNGTTVDWHARVTDGEQQNGATVWTGWSPTCHFTAYPTGPEAPSIANNATYPNTSAGGGTGAAAGTPATFAVTGASGGAAATKFLFNFDQAPPTSGANAAEIARPLGTTASSPANWWTLSDGSGSTAANSVAAANTGTLSSGATWTSDSTRTEALKLNGSSGYVTLPQNLIEGQTAVSVHLRFKTTGSGILFSTGHSAIGSSSPSSAAMPVLYVGSNGKLYGQFWTGGVNPVVSSAAVNDGVWHQVDLVGATSTQTMFLDGSAVGSVSGTIANLDPLDFAGAGYVNTNGWAGLTAGSWGYFNGELSDLETYARALSATEVSAMFSTNNAALTLAPMSAGPHTLYVAAVDAAGDVSGFQAYPFLAAGHAATSCASLQLCMNNTAISPDSNAGLAAADGYNSFSATDLGNAGWNSGGRVTVDGATFTLPQFGTGQQDNVLAANQTIAYSYPVAPNGASSLLFLATSTSANVNEPGSINGDTTAPYVPSGTPVSGVYCFDSTNPDAYCPASGRITYTDGSYQSYFLTVPDWVNGPSSLAAVVLPHRNSPGGQQVASTKLYPFSVPLAAGKTVQSVTLPDVSASPGVQALHIFSLATRDTTTGTAEANGTIAPAAANSAWTGAWAAPTEGNYNFQGSNFSNQTFRVALRPSISGGTVRVKLDNALGTSPITIAAASVAADSTSSGLPTAAPSGAFSILTFGGSTATSVTIPEGGMVFSDSLPFAATQNQWLIVSFQISNSVPYLVQHSWANTAYEWVTAAGSGNHTTDTATTAFTGTGTANGWFTDLATGLDVQTTGYTVTTSTTDCTIGGATTSCTTGIPTQAVLGDGLIDAWQPNTAPLGQNTALRLSDDLAATEPTTPSPYGTVAAGIEANQIMKDYPETYSGGGVGGPSALSRIDRDILDEPGLNTVVLFEGLEDLLNGQTADNLDNSGYATLLNYLSGTPTNTAGFINTDAVGLTPCDGYTGDGATGNSTNDPCTSTVDSYRTTVNSWLANNPEGLGSWTTPSLYYVNPDTAVGVTQPNGEVKLNGKAAIGTSNNNTTPDYANLTLAGYGSLASAILGPQDVWQLNDGNMNTAASTANDSASNASAYLANNPAVGQNSAGLTGGYSWVNDASRGYVLNLDGTSGFGASAGKVLDTTSSFTVSTWVKLSSTAHNAVIAAQDGTNNSGFYLGFTAANGGQWTMYFLSSDTVNSGWQADITAAGATTNWTHLVGEYNAATKTAQLYVDGALAGTATGVTPWAATGDFTIGRDKYYGNQADYFPGEASEMAAWNYALTGSQVSALYQQLGGLPATASVPNGYETEQSRSAGASGTWSAAAQAATIPGASAVSAAGMPNGDTAFVTLAGGQEYIQWHYAADGSWSPVQVIKTADGSGTLFTNITAMAATASTSSDGSGLLQILSVQGGTEHHQTWTASAGWSPFAVPPGGASGVTAVAAAGFKDGTAQFMSVIGGVEHHQVRNADGSWSTFNTLGNSGVTAVAAAALPSGVAQFESLVNGAAYNQARNADGSWSGFNLTGSYAGATRVAAAPDADGSTQFLVLTGTTENWIQRNADGSWTANAVLNTGVSAVALAGFNGAAMTAAWYGTTQALTIS